MKHGPIALIDEKVPVIVLAPHDDLFEKPSAMSNGATKGSQLGTSIPKTRRSATRATPAASEIITMRPPRAITSSTRGARAPPSRL
jgi:glucosamine--fructose-6-phosphate aminotransferase (isomerizing)